MHDPVRLFCGSVHLLFDMLNWKELFEDSTMQTLALPDYSFFLLLLF